MTRRVKIKSSPVAGALCLLAVLMTGSPVDAAPDPGVVFSSRCSSCHSVGKGDMVGPDLRGVTLRHDRAWLHRFIHSSQNVIQSGDPAAVTLFRRYGRQVMPDHPLSDPEIEALLRFIEAGGPGAAEGTVRPASAATEAEVKRGEALFLGSVAFAKGGASCSHCHAAGGMDSQEAGTLAPDLTVAYRRYGDWGLVKILERPQFELPMMANLYAEHPLTHDEAYALTAFLCRAARSPVKAADPLSRSRSAAAFAFGGGALVFWLTGKKRPGGRSR